MNNSMKDLISRAIQLLKEHEPQEGYYLAFSGGKDSCVIKKLAQLSRVKFDAWYNNTTIDPPELVRFIKQHHADVKWNQPRHGAMMARVAIKPSLPPTRSVRWCCSEYKEQGGKNRVKIVGVRAAESNARRKWKAISEDGNEDKIVCPIVDWSDDQVWQFIKEHAVLYCSLYDEGWTRLGCVGCPLAKKENQEREFARWPRYKVNWERAIKANWERHHSKPKRNGEPYYHAKFKTAEDLWQWWLTAKRPDYFRGDCQSMHHFTNEDLSDLQLELNWSGIKIDE